jgi:putative aldouronate transport system permease protein
MTQLISTLGGPSGNLLGMPHMFRPIFVGTNLWQTIGFSSIIYVAALSSIDQELYEAATIDGANRLRQTWHITLPGIAPTITILLILRLGQLLSVGFERIILLYSPAVYETADVIGSFVYRRGLLEFDYSFSTAVGLFNSVVSLVLIIGSNWVARRVSDTSLF